MKFTPEDLREKGWTEGPDGIYRKQGYLPVKLGEPFSIRPEVHKRIRQSSKPLMNKLEQEYFECLKVQWKILTCQAIRLKLGNGIWYKPDFVAWPVGFESQDTRMRAYEVKGKHAFRGGFENLKVAAGLYPQIRFTLAWKENGQWKEQSVLP